MSLKDLPFGEPEAFNVVVEIPQGSQDKYEYDEDKNNFFMYVDDWVLIEWFLSVRKSLSLNNSATRFWLNWVEDRMSWYVQGVSGVQDVSGV